MEQPTIYYKAVAVCSVELQAKLSGGGCLTPAVDSGSCSQFYRAA